MSNTFKKTKGLLLLTGIIISSSVYARSNCQNTGSFGAWMKNFKAEATQNGISPSVVNNSLKGVKFQSSIIKKDRAQAVFGQSFLTFSDRMVSNYRLVTGRKKIKQLKSTFKRIENDFGVPAPVLVTYWGLETDFGAFMGKSKTLPALASLAYDCRRSDLFREHLFNALQLIEKGDLKASEMKGAWAGELGQMQFLPREYNEFAVDYDGDGRRNLIKSSADALASGANLIKSFGWRAGEPWIKEVKVPKKMDWSQARLDNRLMPADWASMGVTEVNGSQLNSAQLPTALLLPLGKNGPAFLAYPNFDVYLEWNQSLVYSTTAAYMATRLSGAPKVSRGNGKVTPLTMSQIKQLQNRLMNRGHDVGKADGIIGSMTRAAVRSVQQELGLPADGYPTKKLLNSL